MAEKTIDILVKFGLDDKAAKQAATEIDKLYKAQKASNDQFSSGKMAANAFGSAIKTAVVAAGGFLTISGAISAMSSSMQNYVNSAGTSESTSKAWLRATEEIDKANLSIGKTLTSMVLPYYEKIAQVAGDIAKAAQETKTAYDKEFNSQTDAGKKRDPALLLQDLLQRPLSTSASVLGGAYTNPQNPWEVNKNKLLAGQPITGAAGNPAYSGGYSTGGTIPGGAGMGDLRKYESEVQAAEKVAEAKKEEAKDTGFYTMQEVQMMDNFRRAERDAKRTQGITLARMERDFEKTEKYAQADYDKTRFRADRDFDRQLQYSEKDFYRQRTIQNRDFNIQLARSEADFQRSRSRSSEDHEFDLYQTALSGDAMSYWLSQRSFSISEKRAKEDFELQKNRSAEDLKRSQQDADIEFNITRERSKEQFEISKKDAEEDFKIQRERTKVQYDLTLEDMALNFKLQETARNDAFNRERNLMQYQYTARDNIMRSWNATELAGLTNMMAQGRTIIDAYANMDYGSLGAFMPGGSGGVNPASFGVNWGSGENIVIPQHANGGYTQAGKAMMHAGEFVMTADTTKAAEGIARGKLSQDNLVQMLSGRSGGSTINQVINSDVSSDTRRQMMDDARRLLLEAM